jgi:hypothetical protein
VCNLGASHLCKCGDCERGVTLRVPVQLPADQKPDRYVTRWSAILAENVQPFDGFFRQHLCWLTTNLYLYIGLQECRIMLN